MIGTPDYKRIWEKLTPTQQVKLVFLKNHGTYKTKLVKPWKRFVDLRLANIIGGDESGYNQYCITYEGKEVAKYGNTR